MTLRVPNPMTYTQNLLDLQRSKERYATLVTQLSTGKRINNLGDDPAGTAAIMNFQTSINRNQQYMSQIDTATNFLASTEGVVDSLHTNITRLLELTTQAMNGTQTAQTRTGLAAEVQTILSNLVSIGNTEQQGKYLFAGTATVLPAGVKPFEANAAVPATPPYLYNGNNNLINLDVGISASVQTNLPGDTLFYGGPAATNQGTASDLLNVVNTLAADLQANNAGNLQTDLDNLKAIRDRVNTTLTELGGWQKGILSMKEGLEAFNSRLVAIQSSTESVDYPTAITQFTQEGVAQQASLSVMAKINRTNLFDYLG